MADVGWSLTSAGHDAKLWLFPTASKVNAAAETVCEILRVGFIFLFLLINIIN